MSAASNKIARRPFVAELLARRGDALIVCGLGSPTWDAFAAGDTPEYLYSWGGMGLAVPTALVVFRLRGAYFAIGTWVVAEVFRLVLAQFKGLGGGTGTSLPPSVTNEVAGIAWVKALFGVSTSAARDIITYWAALTLAAGTVLFVYLILRSRYGLALAAIRDSERAAESVGVDNFKTKLKVYIAAAAGTGLVGALIYLHKARISPDAAFSVADWTANVIFIVVIGGIGTIEGPIVGVLVFYVLQTNLAHWGTWYLILIGAFPIAIMLFAPRGIWGYLAERHGLVLFPIRRHLVANAPVAETAPPGPLPPVGRKPWVDEETSVSVWGGIRLP